MDVLTILENAIREEDYFCKFYKALAERVDNEDMKISLLKLSEFEMLHKEKLQMMNFGDLNVDILGPVEEELIDFDKFDTVPEMFEFAIEQEIKTKNLYSDLSAVASGPAKELLMRMSDDEALHHQILNEKLQLWRKQNE